MKNNVEQEILKIAKEIKKCGEKNKGFFKFLCQDGGVFECSCSIKKIAEKKPMNDFDWFLKILHEQ